MPVEKITSLSEFNDLLENENRIIVVDFYADWCGPCKMIAPFIEKMSDSAISETICFVKCNVDEADDLAKFAEVSAMPTFVAYKDKKKLKEHIGANRDGFTQFIKDITSI